MPSAMVRLEKEEESMESDSRRAGQSLATYSIAPKLRALRMQKGLTLARLATQTGLSTALLSKLETDRMVPTLPTLASICRVYGVGLGFLFADAKKHSLHDKHAEKFEVSAVVNSHVDDA